MRGVTVDGNDVEAVFEATASAVARARQGDGPTLIDSVTYRWEGHYVGDPVVLRPEGELAEWMARCPIARCEARLTRDGALDEAAKTRIRTEIDAEIGAAVEFGKASPFPPVTDLYTNVYATRTASTWPGFPA
jgi:TPP-dependent pyruvate/acetoin dehydrogenase alpha subunit